MKKTISSSMTFIYKFPFPILWIGGFSSGVFSMMRNGVIEGTVVFLTATILGALFLYWSVMRLKVVQMDERKLYISNYFREIEVDRSNIQEVTENIFLNIHPVWVHFKTPTEFGNKIMFMPTVRIFSLFSSHPIVKELKQFANREEVEKRKSH